MPYRVDTDGTSTTLEAGDLRAIQVEIRRGPSTEPLEVMVGGHPRDSDLGRERARRAVMADAGATWWSEWIVGAYDDLRATIALGAIRIDQPPVLRMTFTRSDLDRASPFQALSPGLFNRVSPYIPLTRVTVPGVMRLFCLPRRVENLPIVESISHGEARRALLDSRRSVSGGPLMPELRSGSLASKTRVLVSDDATAVARLVARVLGRHGYECEICPNSQDVLAAVERKGADIVLVGLETGGAQLVPQLRNRHPEVALILLTSSPGVPAAVAAVSQGAFDYLIKPFDEDDLCAVVGRAAEIDRLRRENLTLRERLHVASALASFVAESQTSRQLLALVRRIARVDSPVLIEGETGTGKELIARILHYFSARAEQPFVIINCASLSRIARRASDGRDHLGVSSCRAAFAKASGGTLFLAEIAEAGVALQAEMTGLLEEHEAAAADIRFVASTSSPLAAVVERGAFRRDLFFKLNVITIRVPSLRERREDIVPLAHQFLAAHAARVGRPLALTSEAERALTVYPWPGNIRELRNAVERAVALTTTDFLTSKSFGLAVRAEGERIDRTRAAEPPQQQQAQPARAVESHRPAPARSAPDQKEAVAAEEPQAMAPASAPPARESREDGATEAEVPTNAPSGTLQEVLDRAARARIKAALDAAEGNRATAAKALDVDAATLSRLIRRLGL
jgi:DNA-binding NtrC family response regulator